MAARFVTHPHTPDVVVGSNLFADILTDLGDTATTEELASAVGEAST